MGQSVPRQGDPFLKFARAVAGLGARWHRATIAGLEHLPAGPALLVGNHGLYGFEVPVFFYLVHRETGRFPIGLADRNVFGRRAVSDALARIGGVPGTPMHAHRLLCDGQLVVCYPGGSREVFKARDEKYCLRWERSLGFARVAIRAAVPVVPFAALGVDDSYVNFGHLPGTQRVFGRYAVPFAVGLGPLPLPVHFHFRLSPSLTPPSEERRASQFRDDVAERVMALMNGAQAEDECGSAADRTAQAV